MRGGTFFPLLARFVVYLWQCFVKPVCPILIFSFLNHVRVALMLIVWKLVVQARGEIRCFIPPGEKLLFLLHLWSLIQKELSGSSKMLDVFFFSFDSSLFLVRRRQLVIRKRSRLSLVLLSDISQQGDVALSILKPKQKK